MHEQPVETEGDDFAPSAFLGMGFVLGLLGVVIVALAINIFSIDSDYVTWPRTGGGDQALAASSGATIVQQQGCVACHSADGTQLVGPTWLGLAGSERVLAGGTTVIADTAYIRQAIIAPRSAVVEGYSGALMPGNYGDSLSSSDLDAVVAYVESLTEPAE